MGLFSSIKKAVSKTWSGIKGTVKKVAATVKKVSKKIAYAIPGGKQLWDLSSKVGKGVMKGIGKLTSKLGPVGTMALSFVLAPVMGPLISTLWSGFGAGAAAMAASSNAFVSALGTAGSGVFAAGNFAAGTLGALGNAVTEGAGQILQGNFSAAAKSFATNMSNAFTGKAGMAAVNAGAAKAAVAAGQTVGTGDVLGFDTSGQFNVDKFAPSTSLDPNSIGLDAGNLGNGLNSGISNPFASQSLTGANPTLMQAQGADTIFGKQIAGMNATDMHTFNKFGADGVRGINAPNVPLTAADKLSQVASRAGTVADLMGGGSDQSGYRPYVASPISSANIAKAGNVNGQGSAGFSLLGGVQGLEESLRRSQQLMFN